MKKIFTSILTVVFLLPIVVNTGCGSGDKKIDKAKKRVEMILKGIHVKEEGGATVGNEETAISQWWSGKARILDHEALSRASDAFDGWRREADIFPYISEYTIENAVTDGDDVIVFVTINGMPMGIRVPDYDQVAWSDSIADDSDDSDYEDDE